MNQIKIFCVDQLKQMVILMKLLLCLECNDIFSLDLKKKKCSCGKTKGQYIDHLNAIYEGDSALPIGISNPSFREAVLN